MTPFLHRQYAQERVYFKSTFLDAVQDEMARLGLRRAYILTSPSVATPGAPAHRLAESLGSRCVGVYANCRPHSPRECGFNAAVGARQAGADVLIAVGGGSVIDSCKLTQLCIWRDIQSLTEVERHQRAADLDASIHQFHHASLPRTVAVPTTFSAAEFTFFAGIKNEQTGLKEAFADAHLIPRAIVFDPAVTCSTPREVLLATGIKALDHAIEAYLSKYANPMSDALTALGVQLLINGLEAIDRDPTDIGARADCQLGAWSAMAGAMGFGVGGISHTIGAVLGAHAAVAHGATSCITLPAVLEWQYSQNGARQDALSRAASDVDAHLHEKLRQLVRRLGLPGTLRDVGVAPADFDEICDKVLIDRPPFQHHLSRPAQRADVMEILNACA
jgi:maleylacetate reductase